MAQKGERRMLFDTRGRRKHVIQVVYALLALLMGGSLFLVIGPFNLGELVGTSSGGSSASEVFEDQVERIEGRLAKSPDDEQLLLTLTRAEINTGNSKIEPVAEGETAVIPPEARSDFEAAAESWNRYLKKAGDEPNPSAALLVAGTFFRVAETGSNSLSEITRNVNLAAEAQRIAAEAQPSVGTRSTLAIYEYFDGNFAEGDKLTKEVAAEAGSKSEAEAIEKQLGEYRKRAKQFQKSLQAAAKQERQSGKESLQNPLSLGGGEAPPGG
ncbi:MAG TPA: hypothetical protein VIS95_04005 [Solirubrobacterales bacterium]